MCVIECVRAFLRAQAKLRLPHFYIETDRIMLACPCLQVHALKQVSRELKEDLRAKKAELDAWADRVDKAKKLFE